MSWLDRLEKLFGRWTIPQFPLFIVAAQGGIAILSQFEPAFAARLTLDPDAIRTGEYWRLLTFLFVPPRMSWLFMVFWLYLVYMYAVALEKEWGEFRFLVFFALGAAATAVTSVWIIDAPLSNTALYTSLFLAFATLFPEFELLFFFILPVKVKVLAWVIWALTGWTFLVGSPVVRAGVLASLLNYVLFFGPAIGRSARWRWERWRRNRRRDDNN